MTEPPTAPLNIIEVSETILIAEDELARVTLVNMAALRKRQMRLPPLGKRSPTRSVAKARSNFTRPHSG